VDRIQSDQNTAQSWAVVNTVITFGFHIRKGAFEWISNGFLKKDCSVV
jgi:hypothetical protein